MRGVCQEVAHTKSRQTGPRRWLRAAQWLIAAGLHGRANATTLKVAEDLAARMDYTTGHVRYCMLDIADRLGIDKATVKRHIKVLRELGALAWVQHGTLANVRRTLGLKGYAATATVYAAVIPPAYDHAMGHTIVGSGYRARIVIDQRGQAQETVDNPESAPVENPGPGRCAPPSRTGVKEVGQVDLVGGFNYTEQARPPKAQIPRQRSEINGRPRTAADVQKAGKTVRLVRALVNWTQAVPLRRLEYVLRPWTDRGWDALRIADELNGICSGVRWKPRRPDAFIRAHIATAAAHEEDLARTSTWTDPDDDMASLIKLFGTDTSTLAAAQEPVRTDADRQYAQLYAWSQWEEVAAHYADDPDDALDLYGTRLCAYATGKQAALAERQGAWA